jgi:hypothetical protein
VVAAEEALEEDAEVHPEAVVDLVEEETVVAVEASEEEEAVIEVVAEEAVGAVSDVVVEEEASVPPDLVHQKLWSPLTRDSRESTLPKAKKMPSSPRI